MIGSRRTGPGLERRLFRWLLAMSLVPALILLALGAWFWIGSLGLMATSEPWVDVAETGRALYEAEAGGDEGLEEALARHREALSSSIRLATRWAYVGERVASAVPLIALLLAALVTLAAFLASRRLARSMTRPIEELAGWTDLLAREEPLPPERVSEAADVPEVRALRASLRRASVDLASARSRALEAERLKAWGELARRVAHEMKNPLTPLRLAAHRLERSLGSAPDAREALEVVREETVRLEELAARFAALGRPAEGPTSEIDIGELLESLVASDVPESIPAELRIEPGLPMVEGHHTALVSVFRNLLRNAVEATLARPQAEPGTGPSLLVEAGTTTAADGPWLEVRIADRGAGLPPVATERIFEPDFTTKSGGTGLGLAIARQAVVAHGGTVAARRREGGGAEMLVRLPCSDRRPAEQEPALMTRNARG